MSRNLVPPTEMEIKNDGAIPYASQIKNNSDAIGDTLADAMESAGLRVRMHVAGLAVDTLNDEKAVAIGGVATKQFAPTCVIARMATVVGAVATGDVEFSVGITPGGTEIMAATVATNLIALNDKVVIPLSGKSASIPANSTVYVKVTTIDTTAGAGTLANVDVCGEIL
ncbi:MAG: hypothetical protein PHI12_14065 [Dehalococcoidales bacterium]|nr:hypothetical protein [Dehalococcoidales bacterium]